LLRETQLKADAVLNEAKTKAKDLTDEAELHARQRLAEMEMRLKALAENYKKLENTRDDLLHELKRIAQDTLERAERIRGGNKSFDVDQHVSAATKELYTVVYPNKQRVDYTPPKVHIPEMPPTQKPVLAEPEPMGEAIAAQVKVTRKVNSFFDEIE
jgi:cell division initiation protein